MYLGKTRAKIRVATHCLYMIHNVINTSVVLDREKPLIISFQVTHLFLCLKFRQLAFCSTDQEYLKISANLKTIQSEFDFQINIIFKLREENEAWQA